MYFYACIFFCNYWIASKLNADSADVQVSALIYCMGPEAEHVFKSFIFGEDEAVTYDATIAKFDDYFVPKRNVIFEHARFHSHVQEANETVESYIRYLYELAEHCNFRCMDEEIHDRIVIGIADKSLSENANAQ